MRAWIMLVGGGAIGAVAAGLIMAGAANSQTDAATMAALEARVAVLERALASGPDGITVSSERNLGLQARHTIALNATKDTTVTTGKKLFLTAGDEVTISTGKAKIYMHKSGEISITGTTINTKGSSDITIKGSKVGAN